MKIKKSSVFVLSLCVFYSYQGKGTATIMLQRLGHFTLRSCPTDETIIESCTSQASNGQYQAESLVVVPGEIFRCTMRIACYKSVNPTDCTPDVTSLIADYDKSGVTQLRSPTARKNTITHYFILSKVPTKNEFYIKMVRQCALEPAKVMDHLSIRVLVADIVTTQSWVSCGVGRVPLKDGEKHTCTITCSGYKLQTNKPGAFTVKERETTGVRCSESQFRVFIVDKRTKENLGQGNEKIGRITELPRQVGGKLVFDVMGGTEVGTEFMVNVELNKKGVDNQSTAPINGSNGANVTFMNIAGPLNEPTPFRNTMIFLLILFPIAALVVYLLSK